MNKIALFFLFILCAPLAWAGPSTIATDNTASQLFQLYTDDAEPVISEALASQGAGKKVSASISGHDTTKPLLSHNRPIEVEIHGLRFDKKRRRWSANLMAISGETIVTAMPIAGRFEEVVTLPVLKRQMRSGDTIRDDDIQMRDFTVSRIRGEVVTQAEALIGQTPVRTLSSLRPIRTHEISGPILVKKNSIVHVQYNIPGMEISSKGKAMENGSEGSLIAIRNLSSKTVIHGIVIGQNTISIPNKSSAGKTHAHRSKGESYAIN